MGLFFAAINLSKNDFRSIFGLSILIANLVRIFFVKYIFESKKYIFIIILSNKILISNKSKLFFFQIYLIN